jgi:hypothetical protein
MSARKSNYSNRRCRPAGIGREIIISHADAVVAIDGGAGTFSEMANAWALGISDILVLVSLQPLFSTLPYKRDQTVVDPVCFSGGHLRNNFHTIGLFRSIKSYLGHAFQGQDDARCKRSVRMSDPNICTFDAACPRTSGENDRDL